MYGILLSIMDIDNLINQSSPWIKDPSFRYPNIISRVLYDDSINLQNDLAQILLGARRIGKTSIMRQHINELLDNNELVYFISADNPLLDPKSFYAVIDKITESQNKRIYIFIDEIQDMPDWQKIIKHFYDNRTAKFIISGSSSLVIDQESAKLTGRHQVVYVWPLSFPEAQLFNPNIDLLHYLQDGGYPEIVLGKIEPAQVIDIVESTLYRDLLSLYQIRNPAILGDIIKVLAAKVGTPVSFATLAKNVGADDQTVSKIVDYLIGMRLIFELPIYTRSAKVQLRNPSKYYFVDSGIIHKYSYQPKLGLLAENAVAVQLEKNRFIERSRWGYELENGQEIDFRVGDKRYEVKYRDDWQNFTDQYQFVDDAYRSSLTMIIPDATNIEHPHQEYVGLGQFLCMAKHH